MSALSCLEARIRVLQVERDCLARRRDLLIEEGEEPCPLQPLLTTSTAELIAVAAADVDCEPAEKPWRVAFGQLIQPNREPTT
jgi:hypothetical protein